MKTAGIQIEPGDSPSGYADTDQCVGCIVAESLSATAIDGKTITGATIRTVASGARAQMDGTSLKSINSSEQTLVELNGSGIVVNQPTGGAIDLTRGYRFSTSNGLFGFTSTTTKGYVQMRATEYANNYAGVLASSSSGASGGLYADTDGQNVTTRVWATPYFATGTVQLHGTVIQTSDSFYPGNGGTYQSTYGIRRSSTVNGIQLDGDIHVAGVYLQTWSGAGGTPLLRKCNYAGPQGDWICYDTSSARYKTNIRPALFDPAPLLKLEPRLFDRPETERSAATRDEFGLIAEEVAALGLTHLYTVDEQGRPDSVHYEKLAVALLPLVKAQQARIETLERRLAVLEAKR